MHQTDTARHVEALVEAEIAALDTAQHGNALLLAEFRQLQVRPRAVTVQFSGGLSQTCWMTTRSNGAYCVVYMPKAGYFALCVDSDFGPLDIGVHGPALMCFASV